MAQSISSYTDPGVYISEVVVPGSVSASTVPLTVCLIGSANRTKQAANEAATRGLIQNESITLGATPGAHNVTLASIGNRKTSQTTVTRDGTAIDTSYITYLAATVTGSTLTTLNFTTANKIGISMDGVQPITIALIGGGADLTTIAGNLVTQRLGTISDITAVTPAQIAEGINKALAGAASLGYGTAYGAIATVATNQVVLASPLGSNPLSDIRLYAASPASNSATAAVFGVSLPFQAATILNVANAQYSGTSVYQASYVSTSASTDAMLNTGVQAITRVGSFAGVTSFKVVTDYTQASDTISWTASTAAVLTSSIASATFDVSANNTILLSVDGKASVSILLNGLGSPPPGYVNPVAPAAATPTELITNINAVLSYTPGYGPLYKSVASVSGAGASSKLVLTSPTTGVSSIVSISAPTLNSAVTALFGLSSTQLPYSAYGTGRQPAAGSVYFITYIYTRPSNDYNVPKRYFTPDALYADLGVQASGNQLAIAGGICFDNKAPSVMVIQTNDASFPGNPQQVELQASLTAAASVSSATDIVVLSTIPGVQADLVAHIDNQNSSTEGHPRRGWFGMPKDTLIGDIDTAGTFVYTAYRSLQVAPDSPGRGRLILVAPSKATRNITTSTGAIQALSLDGTYIAAAVAALMTSFTSPSDTLLRKSIVGFDISTFPTYLRSERAILASNGVTVVTLSGSNLTLKDPVSTEAALGKIITFSEISASTQKDAVTSAISDSVDANLVGVVPTSAASFILTIKGFLANALTGEIATGAIAPFKSADGTVRDVNLTSDMQVFQDPTDPTKYQFKYFFNLRLPAKRFFGQYSVNNPFFGS
jgi:hypothetical protein